MSRKRAQHADPRRELALLKLAGIGLFLTLFKFIAFFVDARDGQTQWRASWAEARKPPAAIRRLPQSPALHEGRRGQREPLDCSGLCAGGSKQKGKGKERKGKESERRWAGGEAGGRSPTLA